MPSEYAADAVAGARGEPDLARAPSSTRSRHAGVAGQHAEVVAAGQVRVEAGASTMAPMPREAAGAPGRAPSTAAPPASGGPARAASAASSSCPRRWARGSRRPRHGARAGRAGRRRRRLAVALGEFACLDDRVSPSCGTSVARAAPRHIGRGSIRVALRTTTSPGRRGYGPAMVDSTASPTRSSPSGSPSPCCCSWSSADEPGATRAGSLGGARAHAPARVAAPGAARGRSGLRGRRPGQELLGGELFSGSRRCRGDRGGRVAFYSLGAARPRAPGGGGLRPASRAVGDGGRDREPTCRASSSPAASSRSRHGSPAATSRARALRVEALEREREQRAAR